MKKIFLVFVLALLFFSACSKTQETRTEKNLENTQNSESVSETKSETNIEQETEKKTDSKLKDFFSKLPKMPEYKVVYEVKSNYATESIQTMVLKGTNFKYETEKSSVYRVNDKTYMCISENQVICYEFNEENNMIKTDSDLRENWQNYEMTELPSRTISGTKTRCFGYELSGTKQETCYSDDFVPLYSKSESTLGVIELIATQYNNKVSDSEFELPAKPQEFNLENLDNLE
ncbi:MAG: hypothetical protein QXM96_01360 [Candidatus Woesearchaeota archaeon]